MAIGRRVQPEVDDAPRKVEHERKAARSPGEMYGGPPAGPDGEGMAPSGWRQIEEAGAIRREAGHPVSAGGVGTGTEIDLIEDLGAPGGLGTHRQGQERPGRPARPARKKQQRLPAFNLHRAH